MMLVLILNLLILNVCLLGLWFRLGAILTELRRIVEQRRIVIEMGRRMK